MKRALVLLAVLTFGCEPPPVRPSADLRQQQESGRIDGNVTVVSKARGNVIVFLFDAAHPPPPAGTGRPLSFAVIPEKDVFGNAPDGSAGPFTAPFTFSLVEPGSYLVRGFVDANHDFIPWYDVTSQPNTGDVGGAAVNPLTEAAELVTVSLNEESQEITPGTTSVSFSDTAKVPVDRPAFFVAQSAAQGPMTVLTLKSQPIDDGVVHEPRPAFLIRLVDEDGDGVPDDTNQDGVPDLWPRVFVRKVADAVPTGLIDENDLDKDGVLDESGVDYLHADGTQDGQPDVVLLAAGINPQPYLAQLFDTNGAPNFAPIPMNEVSLIIRPIAVDASNRAAPAPLKTVPTGHYAITVMNFTGQTWRVPNELQAALAPKLGLPSVAGQEFLFAVP